MLDTSIAGPLVFLALFYRLSPRLQAAQQGYLQARTQVAWWHTWKEQYEAALAETDTPTGTRRFERPPRIELDDVSLTFPGRSVPAVAGLSCTIVPGECLGVVGESGGGKTTMLDVVTGLLAPTSGAVRLDGVDLADVDLQQWREHIGLVMQDSPIFYGTVLQNVAWTDRHPDEERARRAVEMANLTDVVERLPEGIHTHLGQRGGRFSGGQRQRLALARALYRDPWLLILDEATSALDSESERVIQSALASLRGSCSMLVVAHRLKTVQIADEILVLVNGRVVEAGTWDDLSAARRRLPEDARGAGHRRDRGVDVMSAGAGWICPDCAEPLESDTCACGWKIGVRDGLPEYFSTADRASAMFAEYGTNYERIAQDDLAASIQDTRRLEHAARECAEVIGPVAAVFGSARSGSARVTSWTCSLHNIPPSSWAWTSRPTT